MESILDALNSAAKLLHSRMNQITKQSNVTIAEWTLLRQITAGVVTQEEMAQNLKLDTSTLSRQLKNLINKDLTLKSSAGDDRRQLAYSLSDAGKQALLAINAAIDEQVAVIFSHWPEDEQQQLQIMLNRLSHSLQRI